MNIIKSINIYDSVNELVYPKYSLMDLVILILSGLREHSVHLYVGFGTPGAIRHGIIGIKIEATNVAVETSPEYTIFFFNCIFCYSFRSL